MNKFIGDESSDYTIGRVGFLVESSNPFKHFSRYELRDHPARTNQSFEATLEGWCGAWNDTSTNAHGMWKVVRVCKNGRAQIVRLEGAELSAALEDLGYPELTPESAQAA